MVKFGENQGKGKESKPDHHKPESSDKPIWYKTWWGALIVIFLILPFWLIWEIWAKTKWNTVAKVVLTLLIIGFYTMIFAGGDSDTSQTAKTSPTATTEAKQEEKTPEPTVAESKQPEVPADFKSALKKAGSYSSTMHLSKQGLYDQLVSEYGEKFSTDAAQYAIDNVQADWNANALAKAKTYQDTMSMSPSAIHDQLTSQYGEKFTQEEADYAIQHLND